MSRDVLRCIGDRGRLRDSLVTESCRLPFAALSGRVIHAAITVHRCLGPGLLESAYRACLAYELREAGLFVETEVPFPIEYERMRLDIGYRVDMIVERQLIVELKTVAKLMPIHDAQLLSYLKLGGFKLGLLLNFHSYRLTDGMKRIVNEI
jgi:GxxExxY protein